MNKIVLIIKREYLSRVRKKSFMVMTIIGPILMAGLIIAPILLDTSDEAKKTIWVSDKNNLFEKGFENTAGINYQFFEQDIEYVKDLFKESESFALVHIPKVEKNNIDLIESSVKVYTHKPLSFSNQGHISRNIESVIESVKLKQEGLTRETIDKISSNVELNTIVLDASGSEKAASTELIMGLSMFFGFLIYIFIFIYGAMVMRGVMEEKTSRIVEIIISSVKPFQLMMGKIIGVALVGFTQFALWIVLTFVLSSLATSIFLNPVDVNATSLVQSSEMLLPDVGKEKQAVYGIFNVLDNINISFLLAMFMFYFVGGYLMYGSLFAAVGSAVDSETDSQQFMMPITIPLIFAIIALQTILENPDSSLAFWCSIFPLTSPIVMMGRLPFNPPLWEIGLSMGLLIIGFIFTGWIAGRIYRIGILMYGQKVNYKTLWKWMMQK